MPLAWSGLGGPGGFHGRPFGIWAVVIAAELPHIAVHVIEAPGVWLFNGHWMRYAAAVNGTCFRHLLVLDAGGTPLDK